MNWSKQIHWPASPRNEYQEGIREIDRAIKERRRDPLPDAVKTSEREIIEMAELVDKYNHDPARFLKILHQDSERFGVHPEDVYETGMYYEEPSWPELGYALNMEELNWLKMICCEIASEHESTDDTFQTSPADRISELCDFLSHAQKIKIPPSLMRGDQ